ncbi:MAG: hypothetical protein LC751_02185 [Actinobacteria bacterium]|nr:hypothetical protein [Actinomycetota bacterium]
MSAAGKKELWERWGTGESISDIARALHKSPRVRSRDARSHRRNLSASAAAQAKIYAHPG